jgi:peptide/nickel transport system ATP-binding protein
MMDTPLLEVRGLDISYYVDDGVVDAVRDVNLTLRPGEILGVVGESGCGKSTLSLSILRLLPPNAAASGNIWFKGRNLLALDAEAMRRVRGHDVAMIFQDPATSLNPTFRVGSQMIDAQRAHRGERREGQRVLRANAIEALTKVGIPDAVDRIDNYPHEFSGGMRQRIMIATTLLLEPALLVADEPTSALDVTLEAQILELLRRLRDEHGTAIVFVSHDLGVIAQICDRVIVMYAGRVVEENDIASLFSHPRHPYTQALIQSIPAQRHRGGTLTTIPGRVPSLSALPPGCKFADRCPFVRDLCRQEEPLLIAKDGGRVRCYMYDPAKAEAWRSGPESPTLPAPSRLVAYRDPVRGPAPGHRDGAAHVEIRNLHKRYFDRSGLIPRRAAKDRAAVRAIDGVGLSIDRGEVLGLVGESGSGKTTLGELILRLQAPTSGSILFDGQDLRQMSRMDRRRFRRRAQIVFQDPYSSLSPRQRVGSLLTEPYRINRIPRAERYAVEQLLDMVGLSPDLASKYPNQLSGGQARRVGIARALSLRPEFVVADEPTAGLDMSAAAAVLNLMRDLQRRLGLTFLIITHNVNLVAYMADRIAVMYLGELVEVGPAEPILESPAHPYTRGLLSLVPEADPGKKRAQRLLVPGEIPSPKNPPPGCRFHPRCAFAQDRCRLEAPALEDIGDNRRVACHFWRTVIDAPHGPPPTVAQLPATGQPT